MARLARVVVYECWHHVAQRGNHQQTVFFSNEDRGFYLDRLRHYSTLFGLRIAGYCLMNNHVHLLVIPQMATSLARAVGRTHNDYARWLNFKRGEIGHVWQNRFYSCPLDDAHRWFALRYVELNPVNANLVQRPGDWPWSSAFAHTTGTDPTGLVDLSDWSQRWSPQRWSQTLALGIEGAAWVERLREATRTGRPLGGEVFIEQVETNLKRGVKPRKRGRKPTGQALAGQMKLAIA